MTVPLIETDGGAVSGSSASSGQIQATTATAPTTDGGDGSAVVAVSFSEGTIALDHDDLRILLMVLQTVLLLLVTYYEVKNQ